MTRKAYRSSVSQVNTFEMCARKWAWSKLDGIAAPPNRYAAFGSRTHKLLEEWFRDGTPPPDTDEGKVARNILKHLPPPQTPGILVEREIDLVLGDVPFKGYVDLSIFEPRERPFVSDHKTTGDLRWSLAVDDMPDDVQVSNYSYEAMLRTNSTIVDVQWTYGTRNGKKALPVARTVTYDEIKSRLEKTARTVESMRIIYEAGVPAIEVPYDASGCEAYGGCPFQANCNLSPQERIQSIMSQQNQESAFLAKLRNKKGKTNGQAAVTHPPPAVAAPTVAAPVPTTSGTVNPPSAPATAPANPEGEAPKPIRKKRAIRTRKPKAATAPAEAPAAAPQAAQEAAAPPPAPKVAPVNAKPAKPAPAATAAPSEALVPMRDVQRMVELLTEQYRKGFTDGLAHSKGSS